MQPYLVSRRPGWVGGTDWGTANDAPLSSSMKSSTWVATSYPISPPGNTGHSPSSGPSSLGEGPLSLGHCAERMIRLGVAVDESKRRHRGGAFAVSGMFLGVRLAAAWHSKQAGAAQETSLVHGSINATLQFRKSSVFRVASRAPARLAMAAICASNWEMSRPISRLSLTIST